MPKTATCLIVDRHNFMIRGRWEVLHGRAMDVQESSPLALRSTVSLLLVPNMVLITYNDFLPRRSTKLARVNLVISHLKRAKSLSLSNV